MHSSQFGITFTDSRGPVNSDGPIHCIRSLNRMVRYSVMPVCGKRPTTFEWHLTYNLMKRPTLCQWDSRSQPWKGPTLSQWNPTSLPRKRPTIFEWDLTYHLMKRPTLFQWDFTSQISPNRAAALLSMGSYMPPIEVAAPIPMVRDESGRCYNSGYFPVSGRCRLYHSYRGKDKAVFP